MAAAHRRSTFRATAGHHGYDQGYADTRLSTEQTAQVQTVTTPYPAGQQCGHYDEAEILKVTGR